MLRVVQKHTPKLYPFLWQCYALPTLLLFGESTIQSQVGVQQGDVHVHVFFAWWLDNGSLAGKPQIVLENFQAILKKSAKFGLSINPLKCEIHFCGDVSKEILEMFDNISPGIEIIQGDISLLGAPLTLVATKDASLKRLDTIKASLEKLKWLKSHITSLPELPH